MRPGHGADHIKGVFGSRDPVADRLVHRILQRRRTGRDRNHPRPQRFHALHIRRLPLDVDRAHEHVALHPEQRRDGRGADAVHPRAGLRDQPGLAHPPRQQRLPDGVVDLVRAGMVQVLALQIDFRAARVVAEPLRVVERGFAPDVVCQQILHFTPELRILLRFQVLAFEFDQRGHQRFGDILAAVNTEMGIHFLISLKNSRILSSDLIPGASSSELERSTP